MPKKLFEQGHQFTFCVLPPQEWGQLFVVCVCVVDHRIISCTAGSLGCSAAQKVGEGVPNTTLSFDNLRLIKMFVLKIVLFFFILSAVRSFETDDERPLDWQSKYQTPLILVLRKHEILNSTSQMWLYWVDYGYEREGRGNVYLDLIICPDWTSNPETIEIVASESGTIRTESYEEISSSEEYRVIRWYKTIQEEVSVILTGVNPLDYNLETTFFSHTQNGQGMSPYTISGPGCIPVSPTPSPPPVPVTSVLDPVSPVPPPSTEPTPPSPPPNPPIVNPPDPPPPAPPIPDNPPPDDVPPDDANLWLLIVAGFAVGFAIISIGGIIYFFLAPKAQKWRDKRKRRRRRKKMKKISDILPEEEGEVKGVILQVFTDDFTSEYSEFSEYSEAELGESGDPYDS